MLPAPALRILVGFLAAMTALILSPAPMGNPGLAALTDAGVVDPAVASTVIHAGSAEGVVVFDRDTPPASIRAAIEGAGHRIEIVRIWDDLALAHVLFRGPAAVVAVAAHPAVRSVQPNERFPGATLESGPVVNQPAAALSGHTGEGTTVAVLDTGARCADLPQVGGACPVVWAEDFAPDDGAEDDDDHGTNVAGVVLAVAPGAKIAALDVFHRTDDGDNLVSSDDALDAIQEVIDRKDEFNIVAVNLSLGGGLIRHALRCPLSPYANAFAALRDNGILPVVAAGNSSYDAGVFFNGVADPACAPGALVVGAVYDSDYGPTTWSQGSPIFRSPLWPLGECSDPQTGPGDVTCFSQTASFLGVLAPGARITAAGITMAGTSQATPHVSGAVALLAEAAPSSTVAQREAAIVNSGEWVFDDRSNRSTRRLELCGALSAVGAACGGDTLDLDRQAAPEDQWRYYYVDLPAGTGLFTVATHGSNGDLDMYVAQQFPPTRQNGQCVQETDAHNETCALVGPPAGRWWIAIYGFDDVAFSIASATADVDVQPRARLPFISGDASFGGR